MLNDANDMITSEMWDALEGSVKAGLNTQFTIDLVLNATPKPMKAFVFRLYFAGVSNGKRDMAEQIGKKFGEALALEGVQNGG